MKPESTRSRRPLTAAQYSKVQYSTCSKQTNQLSAKAETTLQVYICIHLYPNTGTETALDRHSYLKLTRIVLATYGTARFGYLARVLPHKKIDTACRRE